MVNNSNIVYRNTGTVLWEPIGGVSANDIGIGADGSVYVTGKDNSLAGYKPPTHKYNNGAWDTLSGVSCSSIAVLPKGLPWWTD